MTVPAGEVSTGLGSEIFIVGIVEHAQNPE